MAMWDICWSSHHVENAYSKLGNALCVIFSFCWPEFQLS